METLVTDIYFFINIVLDHLLPAIQAQSFLEWTCLEQSLEEFYTILLEELLQIAFELLEVGICS